MANRADQADAAMDTLGGETAGGLVRKLKGFNIRDVAAANTKRILDAAPGSLPAGGTAGQVLTKESSDDGDADWETPTVGGGGSVAWVGPFEWTFADYVSDTPGIYGTGYDGILVGPKGTFPDGSILGRVLWQIDTALNNLWDVTLSSGFGDPSVDYADGGDVYNVASDVHGDVTAIEAGEPNQSPGLTVALSPSGSQSPVVLRRAGSGAIAIGGPDQFFFFGAGGFSSAPSQGAGRTWFEIITPTAP